MHQKMFSVDKRQEILMVASSSNLEMCRSLVFRGFFSVLGFLSFFFILFCFQCAQIMGNNKVVAIK